MNLFCDYPSIRELTITYHPFYSKTLHRQYFSAIPHFQSSPFFRVCYCSLWIYCRSYHII